MTTAILTANAAAAGANVALTYGATNANGTNNAAPINDRLNLTLAANVDPLLIPTTLTDSFCSGTDWVVKVAHNFLFRRHRHRSYGSNACSHRKRRRKPHCQPNHWIQSRRGLRGP